MRDPATSTIYDDVEDLRQRLAKVQGIARGLDKEVARLIDEREEIRVALGPYLKSYDNERGSIMNLRQIAMTAMENTRRIEADLAAARTELEHISKVWPNVSSGDIHDIDHLLSRLGTGEALAAVRESDNLLVLVERGGNLHPHDAEVIRSARARLKEVFGDG